MANHLANALFDTPRHRMLLLNSLSRALGSRFGGAGAASGAKNIPDDYHIPSMIQILTST
ncbi:MAG: hypothetical protein ACXABY_25745 [Candidatus Thorarchaeota archaeon]